MPVCLLFLCFSDQNTPTYPVTLLLHLWESTSKCQAHPPRGMSHNLRPSIRWVGEHWSDYSIQAILRLLIKSRQCCWLLDWNWMFSAHCQWRLQQENCWTNRSMLQIMNNFHFCSQESCGSILPLQGICCGIIAFYIFYSWSFSRPMS